MDYPKLYNQLPKQPIKWSVYDIETWLQFIGLQSLYDKFRELSIDGSCLSSLTEQDLRQQLGIKSGITVKKIMSWITKGLKEYEQFLKSPMAGANNMEFLSGQIKDITQKPSKNNFRPIMDEENQLNRKSSFKSVPTQNANFNNLNQNNISNMAPQLHKAFSCGQSIRNKQMQGAMEEEGQQRKQYELIVQQCDGPQTSFYSIKEEGAKVGRHSSNQILILDQSISRFHAQIKFGEGNFYLRDIGSTTGTFVKIIEKILIQPEMIIQLGSNQLQAHFLDSVLTLQVIEGPSQGSIYEITKNSKATIGRKNTNLISFPDDQHLSNIHASIFSVQNKYYIEDIGTTNGSWMRLSLEGESSNYQELRDKMIFKFGSNQTYSCKIKTAYVTEKILPNACIICYENDKDCVYMPCKHNTACIKCSKNLRECPICRIKIEDFVRIYKA